MSDISQPPAGGLLTAPDLQLVTAQEVLQLLNISMSTLDMIRTTGGFPKPVRIGSKAIRWRLSDVRGWVEQGGTVSGKQRA